MDQKFEFLFKIVLTGDSGVGKTNLLSRYIRNEFSLANKLTIGIDFATKNLTINNKTIKVQIWDTAGQERYKSITRAYYKGAMGAIVVYDITKSESFEHVHHWIQDLKKPESADVLPGAHARLRILRGGGPQDDPGQSQGGRHQGLLSGAPDQSRLPQSGRALWLSHQPLPAA